MDLFLGSNAVSRGAAAIQSQQDAGTAPADSTPAAAPTLPSAVTVSPATNGGFTATHAFDNQPPASYNLANLEQLFQHLSNPTTFAGVGDPALTVVKPGGVY